MRRTSSNEQGFGRLQSGGRFSAGSHPPPQPCRAVYHAAALIWADMTGLEHPSGRHLLLLSPIGNGPAVPTWSLNCGQPLDDLSKRATMSGRLHVPQRQVVTASVPICRPARPPPRLADGRFDVIGSLPPDTRIGQPVPEGGVTHEVLGMRAGVSNRQKIASSMVAEQL